MSSLSLLTAYPLDLSVVNTYTTLPVLPSPLTNLSCSETLTDQGANLMIQPKRYELIKALQRKFPNLNSQDLEPLNKIFKIVTQRDDETVKQALIKNEGYLSRLFSKENWNEWTERRTALGRVVDSFINYCESSSALSLKRLDVSVIQKANAEAISLLTRLNNEVSAKSTDSDSSCTSGLLLGTSLSIMTQNPFPLFLTSLNCVSGIKASGGLAENNMKEECDPTLKDVQLRAHLPSYHATLSSAQQEEEFNTLRMDLFNELLASNPAERVKEFLLNIQTGKSWVGYIIAVGDFVLDVPKMNSLLYITRMQEMEEEYWARVRDGGYLSIFDAPKPTCPPNSKCITSEIDVMRNKLKEYGYDGQHQTPLAFVKQLRDEGVPKKLNNL